MVGVKLPVRAAGLLMKKELDYFAKVCFSLYMISVAVCIYLPPSVSVALMDELTLMSPGYGSSRAPFCCYFGRS